MEKRTNRVVWIDIPTRDIDRAATFYSSILDKEIKPQQFPDGRVAILSNDDGSVCGCLFQSKREKPGEQGPLLNFGCDGRLDEAIAAVEPNGGKVLVPKTSLAPFGWRAIILDSEGNRVALHALP